MDGPPCYFTRLERDCFSLFQSSPCTAALHDWLPVNLVLYARWFFCKIVLTVTHLFLALHKSSQASSRPIAHINWSPPLSQSRRSFRDKHRHSFNTIASLAIHNH